MSTDDPTPDDPPPTRRRARKTAKKSPWQMDLASLGRKDASALAQEDVERPPFAPTLPQVNLLPAGVRDSIKVARMRSLAIAALVALAVIIGGLWWMQGSTIAQAEADLATATADNARLRQDLDALTPVKQMYDQITTLQQVVTTTLASQPEAAVVIQRLSAAAEKAGGSPIDFTSVDVSYRGIPQPGDDLNSCPNPDPFGEDITIGCLTFSANATDRDQVSSLLRAMEDDPLFVGPFVTSTTASEVTGQAGGGKAQTQVAFSGTSGVSLDGLKTLLTPEQIEEILNPPKPTPSATASPEAGG